MLNDMWQTSPMNDALGPASVAVGITDTGKSVGSKEHVPVITLSMSPAYACWLANEILSAAEKAEKLELSRSLASPAVATPVASTTEAGPKSRGTAG